MKVTTGILGAVLVAGAAVCATAQPRMPDRSSIEQAPFIFKGTVVRAHASNVSAVPGASDTAVVRIDEILKAPDVLKAFAKRNVTVKLKPGTSMRARQSALFLTAGWIFGGSIAVREIALESPALESRAVKALIADVETEKSDRELSRRIATSVSIVEARVEDVAPLAETDKTARPFPARSEHDPDFWRAEAVVTAAHKAGPAVGARVTVFFAHSTDELWLKSPKLAKGQEVLLLLHPAPADARDLLAAAQAGYIVTDPLDVQPLQARDRVRALIAKENREK